MLTGIDNFYLIPVGSYALKQLRKGNVTADVSFIYDSSELRAHHQSASKLLLHALKDLALFSSASRLFQTENQVNIELKIELKNSNGENSDQSPEYLQLSSSTGQVAMRVFVKSVNKGNESSIFQKYGPSVVHITQVDHLLKYNEHRRSYYSGLSGHMKTWRSNLPYLSDSNCGF